MEQTKMKLTKEEKDILGGSQGETMAKIMKTLVMFGEMAGAKRLVPITHEGAKPKSATLWKRIK